jgi:murein DD-endopeptidase MepM/ murein hydrolase activator NlpD
VPHKCAFLLNIALLSTLLVPAYFVFLAPKQAEASFMSALSGMFGQTTDAEVTETPANTQSLQSLSILESTGGIPGPTGGSSITIEDDTLVSEPTVSPAGTEEYRPEGVNISIYEVRKGDNLSQIAEMYGVSVNTIRWANDITGPIKEGQILTILPVTGVKYTIKKGDTVASIAKAYKSDADEIISFNGISGALIAGQTIIIPDAEVAAPTKSSGSTSGTKVASGYFVRPVKGGTRTQGIHGHNGVDIASYSGAPIFAAASGEVIIAKSDGGWNGGYGNYIVIKHSNGTQTLYAHLTDVQVSAGTRVTQGDQIGTMGNTGKSTGTHLHFEVRGATNPF